MPVLDGIENTLWLGQAPIDGVGDDAFGPQSLRVTSCNRFLPGIRFLDDLRAAGRLQLLRCSENDVAFNNGQSVDDLIRYPLPSVDARADIEGLCLCMRGPDSGGNGQQRHGCGTVNVVHSTPRCVLSWIAIIGTSRACDLMLQPPPGGPSELIVISSESPIRHRRNRQTRPRFVTKETQSQSLLGSQATEDFRESRAFPPM